MLGSGLLQPWHLLVILVIVLIVFGPGKLPDLGQSLGRGIREFKSSIKGDEDDSVKSVASTVVDPPTTAPKSNVTVVETPASAPKPTVTVVETVAPTVIHATPAEPTKTHVA